jgi:hypothetical protein
MPELWDDYKLMRKDSTEPVLSHETAVLLKEQLESTDQPRLTPSAQIQFVDAFSYLLQRHTVNRKPITNFAKRHKSGGDEADLFDVRTSSEC